MNSVRLSPIPSASANTFLRRASAVAASYGFLPLGEYVKGKKSRELLRGVEVREVRRCGISVTQELLFGLSSYASQPRSEHTTPFQFFHHSPGSEKNKDRPIHFGLEIVGTTKSVAEALILRAALALLEEASLKDFTLHINTVGDHDSVARLGRELTAHLRKGIEEFPTPARDLLRDDPFMAFEYLARRGHSASQGAPRPIDFLSEQSRRHFSEVLEYLEAMKVPYEIDHTLLGDRDSSHQTVFEIRMPVKGESVPVARGGRYDEVGRRIFKSPLPAAGISFAAQAPARRFVHNATSRRPKIFFIQVGPEARLKSLMVLDALREARVPLLQSIGKDTLHIQLEIAQRFKTPYTLIMGHKEALESSVIVRNMSNQSQETVAITNLGQYLRTLGTRL